eukprot:TRINITY_DN713_c0_g1_i1.p1 TRINITY_DN713_c0_g1~~TRINITY_DN713_c0_g1_i1.p1  ORF type:complete len:672 (-),score=214.06 TRINITY_DN713_c0_g1_i1:2910-4925(-)
MVLYNFKSIHVVPPASDFIDIVLSRTQRKTPTIVHKGYAISRIRQFYMRKVKYTQQNYHDKLTHILEDFPKLDDIHPFYADLMNVLYDRDHYKLALGQLNTARQLIDNLSKDYVRMMKYGDSLYRCKQLKRAALGRMCTVMKKQGASLAYLEEVRQHMSRLPSIDPNTRTLLISGYPNVGKSSFVNKVTRANVDVQPYAFTTKSLFIGHMDYRYLRWQVIDTPGILDHALDERNTIEMQSITALAHLRATVLYLMDLSCECGYTVKQQCDLFHSIKPLFANKPLLVILSKSDRTKLEDLGEEERKLVDEIIAMPNVKIMPMSTVCDEGVTAVKQAACDMLLEFRVEMKLKGKQSSGAKVGSGGDLMSRLHLARPVARDQKARPAFVPPSVAKARQEKAEELADAEADDAEKQMSFTYVRNDYNTTPDDDWDPQAYGTDWRKFYDLKNDEWKFDNIPEIMDGMNVADFVDPDIDSKLAELERQEAEEERAFALSLLEEEPGPDLSPADIALWKEINNAKRVRTQDSREQKRTKSNNSFIPRHKKRGRDLEMFDSHLSDLGIDSTKALESVKEATRTRSRSRSRLSGTNDREISQSRGRKRARSESRGRDILATPGDGFRDTRQKLEADELMRKKQRDRNRAAKKGEGDRVILNMMPKHLYSGKRGNGKTDWR